jgi:hypothetical protein
MAQLAPAGRRELGTLLPRLNSVSWARFRGRESLELERFDRGFIHLPGVKRRAEWSWRPAFGSAEAVEVCERGRDRNLDSTRCLLHGRWRASRRIGPLSTLSRVRQGPGPCSIGTGREERATQVGGRKK